MEYGENNTWWPKDEEHKIRKSKVPGRQTETHIETEERETKKETEKDANKQIYKKEPER